MTVSDADRVVLVRWSKRPTSPHSIAQRARIVLLAAEGCSASVIAQRLGISAHTASLWRQRFQFGGPDALMRDAPGRGRKPTVTLNANVRVQTLLATPPPARRWTVRALALAIGISRASVHRVLKTDKLTLTSDSRGDDRVDVSLS